MAMPDLQDGETTEMQGSGAKPYALKNSPGVYSCSCQELSDAGVPRFPSWVGVRPDASK